MQTRLESLIEQILNIGSGFILSMLTWMLIITPLWGMETSMLDNLGIVLIFTLMSIIRGYLWRRYFNWRKYKKGS